jgi:hypothetical protein
MQLFLNVHIILPFIEISLLYRGSQQWLSCIVVVRFIGGALTDLQCFNVHSDALTGHQMT